MTVKRIVEKALPLSTPGLSSDVVVSWVVRTLTPIVREMRSVINSRFGEIIEISDDYTMTEKDEVIIADTSGGNIDVYLPAAIGCTKKAVVKNISTNNVVIYPNPDDTAATVDGAASITISTQYDSFVLITQGVNWYTINKG